MCPPGLLTLFILSARSHGHAFAHSHAYKAEAYILNILWPVNKRAGQMHHPQQTDRFWGLGMFTLVLSPSEASTRFRTDLNREEQKKYQEPMFIRSHTGNDTASDRIDSHILFITWVIWVWIRPNEGLISADVLSFGSRQVRNWEYYHAQWLKENKHTRVYYCKYFQSNAWCFKVWTKDYGFVCS